MQLDLIVLNLEVFELFIKFVLLFLFFFLIYFWKLDVNLCAFNRDALKNKQVILQTQDQLTGDKSHVPNWEKA